MKLRKLCNSNEHCSSIDNFSTNPGTKIMGEEVMSLLHIAGPGSIYGTIYGPLKTARVIPQDSVRSNP